MRTPPLRPQPGSFFRASLLLSLAVAASATCKRGSDDSKAVPAVVAAKTAKAAVQPFAQQLTVIGMVEARPGTFAALSAPGPARVARVLVSIGQQVTTGAPLVEFERAPFEAAAKQAETALGAAERSRDRAARLSEAGIVPRKELDQAATELAQAESAVITARRALELATLRSPVSGTVTRMSAVVGTSTDANQSLVEVADPSALDAVFNLSASDAGKVHPGQTVSTSAGQGPQGEALGTGEVTSVALAVDSASRSVAVRARISHPSRALRIGETVYGRIAVGVHPKAVVIPAEALVPEGEGFKVFVVDSSGMALSHEVKVGGRTEGQAEITDGLAGGESVVTYGAYGIEDSTKIAPTKP